MGDTLYAAAGTMELHVETPKGEVVDETDTWKGGEGAAKDGAAVAAPAPAPAPAPASAPAPAPAPAPASAPAPTSQ